MCILTPSPPLHSTKQTIKTYKKRNKSFYIVEPCHVVRNLIQAIQKGLAGSQSNLFKITSCRPQADAHELTSKKICKCNIIVKYLNEMCFHETKCTTATCVMIAML